jgi:hypothetical protein
MSAHGLRDSMAHRQTLKKTSCCTWAKAALSRNQADGREPKPSAKVAAEHLPGTGIVTPRNPQGLVDPGRPPLRLGPQLSFCFIPIRLFLAVEPTMLSPDGPGSLRDLLVARHRSLRADRGIQPIGNQCGPTRLLSVPRVPSRRLYRSGSSTAMERLSDALVIHLCLFHGSFLLMDPMCIPNSFSLRVKRRRSCGPLASTAARGCAALWTIVLFSLCWSCPPLGSTP